MSVYRPKGKDGRLSKFWSYDFTIDGVRFRGSTKATTCRAAERLESKERNRILLGETAKETITLSEAFERYYQEHAQYQPSGADTDAQLARLLQCMGNQPLTAYSDDDVSQYVARRRGQKARYSHHLVSPATVNRETELLRRVFRRARKNWTKAVADIDWSRHLLPEPQERVREMKAAEETDILQHLRADMVPLVRFCTITGTRLMAAVRLSWADIDYPTRQITLHDKGNARTTGDRTRVIPITEGLLALLANEKGKHPINVFVYQCKRSPGEAPQGRVLPIQQERLAQGLEGRARRR
jgi:integrase